MGKSALISLCLILCLKSSLNSSSSTTSEGSTNTTSNSSNHSTNHSSSHTAEPLVPRIQDGGFNMTTHHFPSNFTCMQVINPKKAEECLVRNMTDIGYSCCFVSTYVKAKSINNTCMPMNSTNLPAVMFMIRNLAVHTESYYHCYSFLNSLPLTLIILILSIILLN